MDVYKYRKWLLGAVALVTLLSVFSAFQLKPSFDFDQFFPDTDPSLEFYYDFKEQFEADDNFLLISLENKPSIYDSLFLSQVASFTKDIKKLPFVLESESVATIQYPIISPFGALFRPLVDIDNPSRFPRDSVLIAEDERFQGVLVNQDATALVVMVKNTNDISIADSNTLRIIEAPF